MGKNEENLKDHDTLEGEGEHIGEYLNKGAGNNIERGEGTC